MNLHSAASVAPAPAQGEFLSAYSLDTLIGGAARLRPQGLALSDRTTSVSFDLLAGQATALARLLADSGLKPGDRLLLTGGAEAALVIALVAALRGGFEPALAPLNLDPQELAAYAQAVDAAALAGPTAYGTPIAPDMYFAVAAAAPSVRLLATLGPQEMDGAIDLSTDAVLRYAASHPETTARPAPTVTPRIITFDRARRAPVFHHQATLMAASLDFISRAGIGRETPILSLVPPVSFAGLVAGPLAAMLSGAPLSLDGPFDAQSFLKQRDSAGHAHLVIPAAVAADFAKAGVFDGLASTVLLTRLSTRDMFTPPEPLATACPVVDLYAIDEVAAVAEPRRAGSAAPPAANPHFIGFDDARILTAEAQPQPGLPLAMRGAAVTAIR